MFHGGFRPRVESRFTQFQRGRIMKINQSAKFSNPVKACGLSLAMTLVLGVVGTGLALVPKPAQAFYCSNCSNWFTQIPEYFAKIMHYGKEVAAWQQQAADMQQQLASIQNMFMSLGIQSGPEMNEVLLNYNVAERCGGPSMSSLLSSFRLNGNGDIYQQQRQVCANIQMVENTKFNETVRFLRDTHAATQTEFTRLQQMNRSAQNVGNSHKAEQSANEALYAQQARFKDWQSKMTAYDSYINTMRENQKLLAKIAMKGDRSTLATQALGQIGRTAILEAALSD